MRHRWVDNTPRENPGTRRRKSPVRGKGAEKTAPPQEPLQAAHLANPWGGVVRIAEKGAPPRISEGASCVTKRVASIGDCDEMTDGGARTGLNERASQHGPNRREHRQRRSSSGDGHCPSGLRELVVACGFDPPAGGSPDGSLSGVADLEDSRTRFIRGGRLGVPARGKRTAGVTRRYVWGAHGAERRTRT